MTHHTGLLKEKEVAIVFLFATIDNCCLIAERAEHLLIKGNRTQNPLDNQIINLTIGVVVINSGV